MAEIASAMIGDPRAKLDQDGALLNTSQALSPSPSPGKEGKGSASPLLIVWEGLLAGRKVACESMGRKAGSVSMNTSRRALLKKLIENYGVTYLLEAWRGIVLSDYHCGRSARSGGARLSIEQLTAITSKVNQVEELHDLWGNRDQKTAAAPFRPKQDPTGEAAVGSEIG